MVYSTPYHPFSTLWKIQVEKLGSLLIKTTKTPSTSAASRGGSLIPITQNFLLLVALRLDRNDENRLLKKKMS